MFFSRRHRSRKRCEPPLTGHQYFAAPDANAERPRPNAGNGEDNKFSSIRGDDPEVNPQEFSSREEKAPTWCRSHHGRAALDDNVRPEVQENSPGPTRPPRRPTAD